MFNILTVERAVAEGKPNRRNIDSLLKRLENLKAVLDEKIVVLSGKSMRRVRPTKLYLLILRDQL